MYILVGLGDIDQSIDISTQKKLCQNANFEIFELWLFLFHTIAHFQLIDKFS